MTSPKHEPAICTGNGFCRCLCPFCTRLREGDLPTESADIGVAPLEGTFDDAGDPYDPYDADVERKLCDEKEGKNG